jgi:outer membrane immunogenic protein
MISVVKVELGNFEMLKWVLATALVCATSGAQAADYADLPVLRGSLREQTSTGRNWDGWYAGGQFGYSAGNLDFSHASQSLTDFMLRNSVLQVPVQSWALLEAKDATSLGFGGFVGRNWQWEDAVISIELNYTNLRGLSNSSGSTMSLQLLNPTGSTPPTGHDYRYDTTLTGAATGQIKDLLSLRARGGWDAGGFMPYIFGGLAMGRVQVSRTATMYVEKHDLSKDLAGNQIDIVSNVSPVPATKTEGGADAIAVGYSLGLGTEMLVAGNLFLRAEWEYVQLMKIRDVAFSVNTARAGIGYRF